MSTVGMSRLASPEILAQLRDLAPQSTKLGADQSSGKQSGQSFVDLLKEGIKEVHQSQKIADKKASDVATGKSGELHEVMLSASQAELSFNLMVQIRNKALEAYQDIMRMPV